MLFKDVVADFLHHVTFGLNLTPNTLRVYRSWIGVFTRWADEEQVPPSLDLRFTTPVLRRFLYACAKAGRKAWTSHNVFASMQALAAFCITNGLLVERFFSTLKREMVSRARFESRKEARLAVFEWIEVWYNRKWRHSALGYLSPEAFEKQHEVRKREAEIAA